MGDVFSAAEAGTTAAQPPPPPSPTDAATARIDPTYSERSDEPIQLTNAEWDITSISAWAALRMFADAMTMLAEATGDVPPTPPVSRPVTPNREEDRLLELRRISSPEVCIGSPEAHPHEPIAIEGGDAPDVSVQESAIARRFFSKVAPSFSLHEYAARLHKYCPHSPGVYLAAAGFCQQLCVAELKVPATNRTIHRLMLASIRVAAKALEDNKWKQDLMSKIGGVSLRQMMHLEVALCFLLDFDLRVDHAMLANRMYLLQQAARHGASSTGRLRDSFRLTLPSRRRRVLEQG